MLKFKLILSLFCISLSLSSTTSFAKLKVNEFKTSGKGCPFEQARIQLIHSETTPGLSTLTLTFPTGRQQNFQRRSHCASAISLISTEAPKNLTITKITLIGDADTNRQSPVARPMPMELSREVFFTGTRSPIKKETIHAPSFHIADQTLKTISPSCQPSHLLRTQTSLRDAKAKVSLQVKTIQLEIQAAPCS
jgi:hypothetical protein